MSLPMLRKAVNDLRWTVVWYAVGLAVYGLLICAVYPTFRNSQQAFQSLLQTYPKAFLQAFGVSADMGSLPAFLGAEYLNVIWALIIAVFAIMAGTGTVAQEVERGTADLWLSVPASRWSLLSGKLVAILSGTVVLVLATVATVAVGGLAVGEPQPVSRLLAAGVEMLAFAVAVGGYAVLLSALSDERGKAAGIAAGLTLAFYLAWIIGGLVSRLGWLRYLSIFSAYKPQAALTSGSIAPGVGLLLVLGILCAAAGVLAFQRRDILG
ncbi:MAG TPA: ABC transporter permease subunit [Thermomicrobiaceae bacterium]|nr:ABC transporter permease subunit [Thermomicrobiaceae bacterium]